MPDTPADELRAAAATLRAAATDATPGPWTVDWPTSRWGDTDRDAQLVGGGKPIATFNIEYRGPLNATYSALTNPAVGAALADWLNQEAHAYDCAVYAADEVFAGDPDGHDNFLTTTGAPSPHALRIAHTINQEQT